MYALGIPIETAARVLGAQYETHRPVDRPLHKATLRHLFERITRFAMLFHLRLKACRVSFELTEFAPTCPSPALKCKSTPGLVEAWLEFADAVRPFKRHPIKQRFVVESH